MTADSSQQRRAVYIISGARTPMAEYGGVFKDVSAEQLGVQAARAAMERASIAPDAIDHVVFGNVIQNSAYGTRHLALDAGLPVEVPALTVNRLCGSGIQAAVSAGQMIQTDDAEVVLCGGMESLTQAPHVIRGLRSGLRLGQGKLYSRNSQRVRPWARALCTSDSNAMHAVSLRSDRGPMPKA